MATARTGVLLGYIRKLVAPNNPAELSDRELLRRFAQQRDEAAFAAVMQRHGPMVLGVCRRVLHNLHDAEDACQATFLVLARKAGSPFWHESVGHWLYEVAYRVARRARSAAVQRALRPRPLPAQRATDPLAEITGRELQTILDEELTRLPRRCQAALVLCCLEGRSRDEAAQLLGCPLGTLKSRLERGRELLRSRLAQRGIELSAVLGVSTLASGTASASLSAELIQTTTQAGLALVAGRLTSKVVSASVAELVERGMRTMTHLKIAAAILLLTAATSTGIWTMPRNGAGSSQTATAEPRGAAGEQPKTNPRAKEQPPSNSDQERPTDLYEDITAASGVQFTYRNGQEADQFTLLETLGGGVALLDYDDDGLLDIFITGGGFFDGPDKKTIKGHACRLYKNLGGGKFKDVSREAGLDRPWFYTHGAAVADYDGDGWPDLLVTGWGELALFHNEPDGKGGRRFVDVSRKAGLPRNLWTTSAAWVDLDGDGYPDLYVCQYVNWSPDNNPVCSGYSNKVPRDICPPKQFKGLPHHVFRNNGDGTFTDISKEAGLRPHTGDKQKDNENGMGLGVIVVDVNEDGKPDLYIANDTVGNFLYVNKSTPGKIHLEELGLQCGVARDDRGVPNGSKGVDAGDPYGAGRPSLWCTNYENEVHGLYKNQGRGQFLFNSPASGIAAIGQEYVGFGTGFLDFDNDGWEDLVIANGHIIRFPQSGSVQQRPVLLRNRPDRFGFAGRFVDVTDQSGGYFRTKHTGRGLAIGDLDNDGFPDLVISHLNEPVVILRNRGQAGKHWLGLQLLGKNGQEAVGAKVQVEIGDRVLPRFVKGGGSYLSSGDRRLLFGLDNANAIKSVRVVWPSGLTQEWSGAGIKVDRYWQVREGASTLEGTQRPREVRD
jgi:RNA polymerase sigma factor (sigma-70 family)